MVPKMRSLGVLLLVGGCTSSSAGHPVSLQFANAVSTTCTDSRFPYQGAPMVLVRLLDRDGNSATGDKLLGGTLLGAKLSVVDDEQLVADLRAVQPENNTAEVHTSRGDFTVTFAPGTFDLRVATDASDPTGGDWAFHVGQTVHFTWSQPADLTANTAPDIRFRGDGMCGEVPAFFPIEWRATGSISSDELEFVVPTPSPSRDSPGGFAFVTVGEETLQAETCEGPVSCPIQLSHIALHRASTALH
jgi:hypothetical protein